MRQLAPAPSLRAVAGMLAPVLLAAPLALTATGTTSAAARPAATHRVVQPLSPGAHPGRGRGGTTPRHHSAIRTSNRAAVTRAFHRRFERYEDVAVGWTGSTDNCRPGAISSAARAGLMHQLNFVRRLVGLAPVHQASQLNRGAQDGALLQAANDQLSHTPPRSWRCWTSAASRASSRSNLDLGQFDTIDGTLQEYLSDWGSFNHAVGHRRWLLYPYLAHVGLGMTSTSSAIYVISDFGTRRANPAWVAWPSRGWFPAQLEPQGRWSLSAGSDEISFAHARVSVTVGGADVPVQRYRPETGYGKATLVWQMTPADPGTYHVTVSHIENTRTHRWTSHRYTVHVFHA